MTTDNDNAATVIADLAQAATEPRKLELGGYYTLVTEHGVEQIDLGGDEYRDFPRRKTGTVTVRDVASFAQYFGKHSDPASEVFADLDKATITAVLDAHGVTVSDDTVPGGAGSGARWQGHRLVLGLQQTEPWKAWVAASGRLVSQADFAEFLEAHAADVAADGPITAADLLEVAQKFHAHTGVKFESGQRLQSGETQFVYIESIEAKAGQRGELTIPSVFELGIVPFEDCAPRRVTARFRYRLSHGGVQFGFVLEDPARIARAAVAEVVAKAAAETGAAIMQGTPA